MNGARTERGPFLVVHKTERSLVAPWAVEAVCNGDWRTCSAGYRTIADQYEIVPERPTWAEIKEHEHD